MTPQQIRVDSPYFEERLRNGDNNVEWAYKRRTCDVGSPQSTGGPMMGVGDAGRDGRLLSGPSALRLPADHCAFVAVIPRID
ncbi:hypothetical protein COCCADRAFT_91978 [Bipolaris zeicola 26-R-13]|uniref:Uncharacterized protein n=1 Tax=Cochliobolus carbonum (strain 26-R-13) TaxID=930089 RepID=W6Y624_COCC2|nr:uncharacterized protein COCCADRAFT_91978 [Bipolaris zeicola 26-R-13]EUC34982.1 hypothetical protein COCCADRAFT_91978 [Bipolaris zeicola 26-R-13]